MDVCRYVLPEKVLECEVCCDVIKRKVVQFNRIEELNFVFDQFEAKTSGIACGTEDLIN